MDHIRVGEDELAAAVKALGIALPIRSAFKRGRSVVVVTRAGEQVYTPRARKARKGTEEK